MCIKLAPVVCQAQYNVSKVQVNISPFHHHHCFSRPTGHGTAFTFIKMHSIDYHLISWFSCPVWHSIQFHPSFIQDIISTFKFFVADRRYKMGHIHDYICATTCSHLISSFPVKPSGFVAQPDRQIQILNFPFSFLF